MQEHIRNIGIIAHIDAGKTTTSERLLYLTGKTHRLGGVDQGTATMDWMEQEQNRGITITSAATTLEWNKHTINLIDTPGHVDFTIEVERSLKVLDGAIGVFCAVGGVEPQSETVWRQSEHYHVAKIAYINKLDRLGADFFQVLQDIEKKLNIVPIPLMLPIGVEKDFEGTIDVLENKEIHWDENSDGVKFSTAEIRSELALLRDEYYNYLVEQVSEVSNDVADLFLEDAVVSNELLIRGLKQGVMEGKLLPVFCGASLKNIGIQPLLDGIITYLPHPNQVPLPPIHELSSYELTTWNDDKRLMGMVFKTEVHKDYGLLLYTRLYRGILKQGVVIYDVNTGKKERVMKILRMHSHKTEEIDHLQEGEIGVIIGPRFTRTGHTISNVLDPELVLEPLVAPNPVITTSIEVDTLSERDKLLEVLEKIEIEDPSFQYKEDENTGQLLISGMGELHLDVVTTKIKSDHNISVRQGKPQVSYREGITKQYITHYNMAEHTSAGVEKMVNIILSLQVEPSERGSGITFINQVEVSRSVPQWWIDDVKQSILDSSTTGIILGYPVIDITVTLVSLEIEEEVSKKDFSLKFASAQAYHIALKNAGAIKLEPIMRVVITAPEEFVGDAVNTISSRKGIVHEVQSHGIVNTIEAEAPMSELFGYSTILRNATQGRATFILEFSYYAECMA